MEFLDDDSAQDIQISNTADWFMFNNKVEKNNDPFSIDGEELKKIDGLSPAFKRKISRTLEKRFVGTEGTSTQQNLLAQAISGYSMFDLVQPPYNLDYLSQIYEISPYNYAAINAKVSNIVGLGYSFVGTATGPLANGTSNVSIASSGGNVTVSAGGTANLLTVTSTGILGTFVNSSDVIRDYATVSVSHDYNLASVLYVSGVTGALSLTFTNIPTTNSRALVIPVIVAHGATAMTYPTSISINGVGGQTINYLQGTTPTARTNKTEVLGLTLIRTASSTWVVLGLVSSYG